MNQIQINKKNISLLIFDTDLELENRKYTLICFDNYKGGFMTGNYLKKFLNRNGEIRIYEHEKEKLSGIRLLKDIREKFPELPVIITTASNKAETVSYVIKSGATALWTKPGVDYIYSDDYYLHQ